MYDFCKENVPISASLRVNDDHPRVFRSYPRVICGYESKLRLSESIPALSESKHTLSESIHRLSKSNPPSHKEKTPPSIKEGRIHVRSLYYLDPVNCSSSVEPFNAVVEEVPPEITIDTWSK